MTTVTTTTTTPLAIKSKVLLYKIGNTKKNGLPIWAARFILVVRIYKIYNASTVPKIRQKSPTKNFLLKNFAALGKSCTFAR